MFRSGTTIPLVDSCDVVLRQNCRRIIVLGTSGVGKTAVVSRFLNDVFDDRHIPTIEDFHQKIYQIRDESYNIDILDTSGNNPFPAMRRLSIQTGDMFVLVYSIDQRESFEEVKRLRQQILEIKGQMMRGVKRAKLRSLIPIVIVGNKCDRDLGRQVATKEMNQLPESFPSCACLEASAKKNVNIEESFLKLLILANLPTDMSPLLRHRVRSSCVLTLSPRSSRSRTTLRRRFSDVSGGGGGGGGCQCLVFRDQAS